MTSREQPVRAPSGLPYGERQKLEQAQEAIPLPAQPSPGGGGGQQEAPVERPDVFAPTGRPSEPLTAGAAEGAGPQSLELLPPDPVAHLRALYQRFPHDDLRRLLERASEGAASRPAQPTPARPQASPGGSTTNGRPSPTTAQQPTVQRTPQTPSPAAATPPEPPEPPTGIEG